MTTDFQKDLACLYDIIDREIEKVGITSESNFCGTCSKCCHYLYRFPVSSLEIEYIRRIYDNQQHPPEFVDFLNGKIKKSDGTLVKCPYCSETGCSIYEARPMCCRLYGLSPFRPLLDLCVFRDSREKTHKLWRELVPLFRRFIDLKFAYYEAFRNSLTAQTLTDFLDRGNVHLVHHELEKALRDFQEALAINDRDAIAHSYMGALYESTGDIRMAYEEYHRAIELDPLDYGTHIKLGLLYHSQNNLQKTYEHYSKALEIDPLNAQIWGNLGLLFISMNKWNDAEDAYKRALQLEPNNSIYHVCLGNVWYAMKDIPRTVGQMQKAIELNPEEDIAYLCLGSIYENKGKIKKSLKEYQNFVRCTADINRKALIEEKIKALQNLLKTGSYKKA